MSKKKQAKQEQPKQEAQEQKQEQPKSSGASVVNNKRKGKVSVAGVALAHGESLELTKAHKDNENLMKKIEHGHKTGLWTYKK